MTKENFTIQTISKNQSKELLSKYHYLHTKNISKSFKSGYNYGLFKHENLVGVIIFTGLPVPELAVGLFGLSRNNQNGLFELSRLCLDPTTQTTEHNITSWFVSRAIHRLCKDTNVRAILSYADANFHTGKIYQACNFTYYGLTAPKSDFWAKQVDGIYIKMSRGGGKTIKGEWRPRSRKHRYLMVFDKKLVIKWEQKPYPASK